MFRRCVLSTLLLWQTAAVAAEPLQERPLTDHARAVLQADQAAAKRGQLSQIAVLATAHLEPTTSLYIIMGSWFLKMVAVIVVMAIVKNMDFYDRGALVSMLIGAIVVVLGAEFYGVLRTRVLYVDEVAGE